MNHAVARIIGQTRRRVRTQRVMNALAITGTWWAMLATVFVYLLKVNWVTPQQFWFLFAATGGLTLLLGMVVGLLRLPAGQIAKKIDNAHQLHDRIGTALELSESPAPSDFMRAQIADAVARVPALSSKRAAPLRWPRDIRPLALVMICLSFVVLLRFPTPEQKTIAPAVLPKLAVDPAELEPFQTLAQRMQEEALAQEQPELTELATELNKLYDQIQRKELTKKELFAKLAELEKKFMEGLDGNFDELLKKLKKVGRELKRETLTKDLGRELEQANLKNAQQELKKLAERLDKMNQKQQKALARSLKRAAKQKLDTASMKQKLAKLKKQIRRLKKKMQRKKDQLTRRRLRRKKRQLQRLNRQMSKRQQQNRQLQRLNRQMNQAAAELLKKLSPEARKALQKLAQQMGRFANQKTKLNMMGKAQSQLMDLKELLRRLGKGGKGQKGKLQDFFARAGGKKKGQKGKKGQGEMNGKGGKKGLLLGPGGKSGTLIMPGGSQPGGQQSAGVMPSDSAGTGSDPNLKGQATSQRGRRKDIQVRGADGKGPSSSEVILGAAEEGFSTQSYRRVFNKYTPVVEAVLRREDIPLGYKQFIKRYFQLIKPR